MPQRDYYEILGVPRTATEGELRKAYLKLAHKYHPDKTGGDKEAEEKLKEINAAYDTLKNKEKRAQYDRYGHAAEQFGGAGGPGGPGGGFGGGFNTGFEGGFEDIFDMFFGGRGGPRRSSAQPGDDLEYRLRISLREAAFGTSKPIRFERMEACAACEGLGAAPGSRPEKCPTCMGSGQVRQAQGFFSVTRPCRTCRGTGSIISNPCPSCSGGGRTRQTRELNVDIPAGVDNGSRLRLQGEGEPGIAGGKRGDLFILVQVETDPVFTRNGNDVVCEVPISFPQAALGDTIEVPTLKGKAELKVPAGTQPGTPFRLRGLGIPDVRGYRKGDQIVEIHVETPKKISREQRELLEKFKALSDEQDYPIHKRFIDRVKKSFGG